LAGAAAVSAAVAAQVLPEAVLPARAPLALAPPVLA
jgi:hypothetical protein